MKKILAAILALASIATFAACASSTDSGNADTTAQSGNSADTTVADTAEALSNDEMYAKVKNGIEAIDYEGYTFTIMDREEANWGTYDVFAETETGDPINDAVYRRNATLEELYNIKIAEKREKHGYTSTNPSMVLAKLVLANEDSIDLVTDGLCYLGTSLAVPGLVFDLNSLAGLNLDADHWDQRMNEEMSVANKLYFATGDVSIMDNEGTWCVLFNKGILNDLSLDDPYALVNDGTWTLATMHEMSKKATLDLDGDGQLGDNDQWGLFSEYFNVYALWAGSGEKITTKNDNDIPELTLFNERSVSVFEKSMDFHMDTTACLPRDRHSSNSSIVLNDLYKEGKALFVYGGLFLVSQFRDSEVDFGILPCPKYDEIQDEYHNSYSFANITAYSIPITAGNIDRTANIFESMAALSKYSLTPAYYDITLEGKFLRDEESAGMIDIILATRNFDLGTVFNFGGTFSLFQKLYESGSYDMASQYAAIESTAQNEINEFVASLNK